MGESKLPQVGTKWRVAAPSSRIIASQKGFAGKCEFASRHSEGKCNLATSASSFAKKCESAPKHRGEKF